MFHYKLIELESEIVAKEQSRVGIEHLPAACSGLMHYVEQQIGVRLADAVPKDWKGWLSYQRAQNSILIYRGRAFKDGILGKWRAGFDVAHGADSMNEYKRGFDVSPDQELDHLLINFGGDEHAPRVFLWYGENIAPYKLIYMGEVMDDPHHQLGEAIVEACGWIIKRPKHCTLTKYLEQLQASG